MASEQAAETSGGSLADRISKPAVAPEQSMATDSPAQQDGAPVQQGGSELQETDEYDVEVKLSDLQADPNNPLYSAKTFEELNLHPNITKGLLAMNFRKPSKIQERALPLLLGNPPTNMIGQSQSGTGKTAAFVLNILHRLQLDTEEQRKSPQALILAPTRELARQIVDVIELMGRFLEGLKVEVEVPAEDRRKAPVQASVIVGTPGTVVDHLRKRLIDPRNIKVLVLDEADNMVDAGGHGDQCLRAKSMLPKTAQVVLFSATFPDHVTRYADRFAPNANKIHLKAEELTVEGIKQLYLDCENDEDKYNVLVKLYGLLTIGSSIIFVKTRATAAEIEKRMVAEGHTVASLTAGVEGSQRDKVIDEFREGKAKVLVTTNVLARGIDVSTVSMVINYDIPEIWMPQAMEPQGDPQTYLHRIGRTGRFGRVGVSISFVSNKAEWKMLMKIQDFLHTSITRIDTRDWDEVEEIIKKTIKNPRSQAGFTRTN